MENTHLDIYFAGGCFWGVEKYFEEVKGVVKTDVGYANGKSENPSYEDVCRRNTGHAEAVHVVYDSSIINLEFLLDLYFDVIDPFAVNAQGNDIGVQYRTGIYYVNLNDEAIIKNYIENLQKKYNDKIAVEVKPLENYYIAEEYHQKYLDKNPGGYCHIGEKLFEKAKNAIVDKSKYSLPSYNYLKENLSSEQFNVTQNNATEPPFNNEYFNNYDKGIYVDITTGEPLFLSTDKFESGCGWPSFSKPIDPNVINNKVDKSFGMLRTEVRSRVGDAHLGHVFDDGIKELGGKRYCINSASLKFIPKDEMKAEGYEYLLTYVK
ncbi:peptide-methionine (R)-S-oxide reductase MsrB [Clostridium cylindrosporum]|uniref:Multifunctional fusion protein n=1 Tax=Clostridium cylindrosporum DSM 605 TaxID=1121307 RepID=A0A0J8D5A3_CLOCY|nr:peptide-methionine (R)-S-oxide reductase MsrB [Clostridium cylindrosporum]KMT20997.1 peptide methionine sulfoxide reductase MsrA/MsrB [Clostridium cylindrosporum DSM 605]